MLQGSSGLLASLSLRSIRPRGPETLPQFHRSGGQGSEAVALRRRSCQRGEGGAEPGLSPQSPCSSRSILPKRPLIHMARVGGAHPTGEGRARGSSFLCFPNPPPPPLRLQGKAQEGGAGCTIWRLCGAPGHLPPFPSQPLTQGARCPPPQT